MKGMSLIFFVLVLGILVATLWNSIPAIKTVVHSVLDPTAGALLNWNLDIGFLLIVFFFTILTTAIQKYTTDQKTLREIKEEQKLIQEEMKKYREHPEKLMEFQKKSMELAMKSMPITMRPLMYTSVPFILFFRWFNDYFVSNPVKIFGFFSWFWAYLLFAIIFSSILRKVMKVY